MSHGRRTGRPNGKTIANRVRSGIIFRQARLQLQRGKKAGGTYVPDGQKTNNQCFAIAGGASSNLRANAAAGYPFSVHCQAINESGLSFAAEEESTLCNEHAKQIRRWRGRARARRLKNCKKEREEYHVMHESL